MEVYSCDLETNNHVEDCHMWAGGVYNIYTEEYKEVFNMADLFKIFSHGGLFYFHNLKFDGGFVLDYLLNNDFVYNEDGRRLERDQYNTIISDNHVFYQIKINISGKIATINDSFKIIPASIKSIPKMFGLPESKGEIDYNKPRPLGYIPSKEESDYLKRDCVIAGKAIKTILDQGLKGLTTASNAFKFYEKMLGEKQYNRLFPILDPKVDNYMRSSYKGGYCYVNKNFKSLDVGCGVVYDKNSMYPWVMREKSLPFGTPVYYEGEYKKDELYPLFIQRISCEFEIKKKYLPTIQVKNTRSGFIPTEYLESSEGKEVVLTLTNLDLAIFKKHYKIYNLTYHEGYKFMSTTSLFKDYVDYWYKVKEDATRANNSVMRTIAKLMLNSLYGKFGARLDRKSAIPYLDEEGKVRFSITEPKEIDGKYLPVAIFITAYARYDIISNAQANINRFLYADTDSLHLLGLKEAELDIDSYRLGAWKKESTFKRARYIRAKRYIEVELCKYKNKQMTGISKQRFVRKKSTKKRFKEFLNIKCGGLPASCHAQVTWDNFKEGMIYTGKLQHRTVKGGVILSPVIFTLH